MKTLSLKDLSQRDVQRILELGYQAGNCDTVPKFEKFLGSLRSTFPIGEIVTGYGSLTKSNQSHNEVSQSIQFPVIKIHNVYNSGWPTPFLKVYLSKNFIDRDSHFYDIIQTQRPKLWIDLYSKAPHAFDPWTKTGFDKGLTEIFFDHDVTLTARYGMLDNHHLLSNYSINFLSSRDFYQCGDLLHSFYPFLHEALIRSLNSDRSGKSKSPIGNELSLREKEILKWGRSDKLNC